MLCYRSRKGHGPCVRKWLEWQLPAPSGNSRTLPSSRRRRSVILQTLHRHRNTTDFSILCINRFGINSHTQLFKPYQFLLRIRRDIRKLKSTSRCQRYGEWSKKFDLTLLSLGDGKIHPQWIFCLIIPLKALGGLQKLIQIVLKLIVKFVLAFRNLCWTDKYKKIQKSVSLPHPKYDLVSYLLLIQYMKFNVSFCLHLGECMTWIPLRNLAAHPLSRVETLIFLNL